MEYTEKIEYWLREFSMPKENIKNCATQIAQGYGACRYLDGVKAGAEAVNELDKKGEASEDLETEIQRHLEECLDVKFPTTDIEFIKKDVAHTARRFANWQKEQIMKDAVTMIVGYWMSNGLRLDVDETENNWGLGEGDKVKIIIIKEG